MAAAAGPPNRTLLQPLLVGAALLVAGAALRLLELDGVVGALALSLENVALLGLGAVGLRWSRTGRDRLTFAASGLMLLPLVGAVATIGLVLAGGSGFELLWAVAVGGAVAGTALMALRLAWVGTTGAALATLGVTFAAAGAAATVVALADGVAPIAAGVGGLLVALGLLLTLVSARQDSEGVDASPTPTAAELARVRDGVGRYRRGLVIVLGVMLASLPLGRLFASLGNHLVFWAAQAAMVAAGLYGLLLTLGGAARLRDLAGARGVGLHAGASWILLVALIIIDGVQLVGLVVSLVAPASDLAVAIASVHLPNSRLAPLFVAHGLMLWALSHLDGWLDCRGVRRRAPIAAALLAGGLTFNLFGRRLPAWLDDGFERPAAALPVLGLVVIALFLVVMLDALKALDRELTERQAAADASGGG